MGSAVVSGVPAVAPSPGTLPGGSVGTAPAFWMLIPTGAAGTPGRRSSTGHPPRSATPVGRVPVWSVTRWSVHAALSHIG
jgi:hypothetical protein